MTIAEKCSICRTPTQRQVIALAHNEGMRAQDIAAAFHSDPSVAVIRRHLQKHDEGGRGRHIPVVVTSMRERVYDIQRLQVEEIERRVEAAQAKAEEWSKLSEMEGWEPRDWSYYFDILSKDMQAAVASIIKTQGLADKREKAQGDLKLGLFEAMANAGLAPKALVGGKVELLESGEDETDDGWQERGGDDDA